MSLHRNMIAALVAGITLALPGYGAAQDEVGMYGDIEFAGAFEEQENIGPDDWYYDAYDMAVEQEDAWWSDRDWYDNEYYTGLYDDDRENDWFFDSYDDPGDEGFFDV